MSLNFVETLLDKLIFPFHGSKEISLHRKFSGSQNLMGINSGMNSNIISEFHQLLDSDYFAPNFPTMNNFTGGVKNNFQYFESSNHSLVSRVPKLVSPSFSTLQDLHLLSSQTEFLFRTELLNRRGSILNETLDQLDLFKINFSNVKKPEATSSMPGEPVNLSSVYDATCAKPVADLAQDSIKDASNLDAGVLKSQKHIDNSCHTLNVELSNRKAKELHKRSKKRRRRQKKSNVVNSEKSLSKKESATTHSSQSSGSGSLSVNHDIICDIVSITGQSNGVKIILPDLPSFVISVESGDDDADWDACSDSEWLTECAEFELSGLFVTNLMAPISSCPGKGNVSHLDIPPIHEDNEMLKHKNMLLCVNKTWKEDTKEWEGKPKLPSKISFAPEEELVEVLFVENYERKGEWEIYALERIRFKKRIEELESVLSPCLSKEHRAKVFHKLYQTDL